MKGNRILSPVEDLVYIPDPVETELFLRRNPDLVEPFLNICKAARQLAAPSTRLEARITSTDPFPALRIILKKETYTISILEELDRISNACLQDIIKAGGSIQISLDYDELERTIAPKGGLA